MTQTPDQDRDYASEFRQLVEQADAAQSQSYDPMAPADTVPLVEPGLSGTAKALEGDGLFEGLAKQNRAEREADAEKGIFGSFLDAAVGKAKSIFTLDDDSRRYLSDRLLVTPTAGLTDAVRTARRDAPLSEMEKGLARGAINRRGSSMGGMAQIAGDLGAPGISVSLDESSKSLFDVSQSDLFRAKVETLGKIKSEAWFSDTMDYVSSKFGEGVGSSVESFATALSPLGLPGTLALGYTGSIGEIRQELQEAGVTDPGQIAKYSYLAAIPHAALDQFTEVGVLAGLSQQARKEITKKIVRTVLASGGKEGATEAAQRVIEIGAVAHALGGDSPNTAVLAALSADLEKGIDSTILESGVSGFIPGLGFGAVEVAGDRAMPDPTEVPKEPGKPVQEARAKTGTMTDASPAPAEEATPAIPAGKRTRTIDLDGFTPAQLQNEQSGRTVPSPDIQVGPDGEIAPRIVRDDGTIEWESDRGTRRVVGETEIGGEKRLLVQTGDARQYQVLRPEELDREIQVDESRIAGRETVENAATQEAQDDAARPATQFVGEMEPRFAARAKAALDTKVRLNGGEILSRAAIVERRIEEGATVETVRGERRLVNADGSFMDAKSLTKTGLDYAEYLTRPQDVIDQIAEAVSSTEAAPVQSEIGKSLPNGFIQGPDGYRVRVTGRVSSSGGVLLDKRSPGGIASGFYIGRDGNLFDADNVHFNRPETVAKVWVPETEQQREVAAALLSQIALISVDNVEARTPLKAALKDLVLNGTMPAQSAASVVEQVAQVAEPVVIAPEWRTSLSDALGLSEQIAADLTAYTEAKTGTQYENALRRIDQALAKSVASLTADAVSSLSPQDREAIASYVVDWGLNNRQMAQFARALGVEPGRESIQAAVRGAAPDATDTSDSAYKRLVSVLAGKTTRTGWAKATKVSEKTLGTLLARAEKDGLVRKDSAGNYRRGKDIKAAVKALRKGAPAATPRRETVAISDSSAAAPVSPLPAPTLSIPADMRIEKAISARERKLRRPLPPYITSYAREIERARGTPEMDAVISRMQSDEMIRKAEMHELAALVGKKVTKSATKKAALQTILDRHNDAIAARVGAVLEQEPEANADSTAVLEDAGRVLEEGISQLLQEIGAIEPVGEPSGGDRIGSGELGGGPDGGLVDEIAGGDGRADAVRGVDPADGARDGASGLVAGPAEVLTDEQRAAVAAKVAADKEAADQKRRDRETLNYQITDDDKIGQGGPKAKIRANIAAIKVLRTLEDEGRGPTEAEKKVLVKYTGWGAFSQDMFEEYKPDFKKERDEFRSLVSNDEYEAARNSTRNAHYTSPDVVNAMWDAMQYLGFKGGRAIEPGAGSGNFIGLTPANLREATEWTAVELDPLTGGIAKNLYQATDVRVQGYQDAKFPNGFFDLAISNVPFSSNRPYDAEYKGKFVLHDYYFVKSLDKVRPGGIVAFITSSGTMDKRNAAARREIAKRADLVGAIRLPGGSKGAFKSNAGTDVTTDIIFLRKRVEGEPVGDQSWLNVEDIQTPEGPTAINSYYAQNPDMMLGKMRLIGSMYGENEPVLIGPSENLDQKIMEAVRAGMPENVMTARGTTAVDLRPVDTETEGIKDGAYYVKGKDLYRKVAGVGEPQSVPKAQREKIEMFLGLRDIVNEMLAIQGGFKEARPERMGQLRKGLNESYDAFVKAHGPIKKTVVTKQNRKDGKEVIIKRFPNISAFEDDPDAYKVAEVEVYDEKTDTAKKAAIFTQDIVSAYIPPDVQVPADALAVSLNEVGRVDIPLIANRLGLTEDEALAALGDQVYLDPVGEQYRTSSEYLAGDVVGKLETARTAAETNPAFGRNVAALEAVQPEPLTRADIRVSFGAPYVPVEIYEQYLTEVLKARRIKLRYDDIMARWYLVEGSFPPESEITFGTKRRKVADLVEAALNSATITITNKDDEGKPVRDGEAEAEARAKVDIIKDTFSGDPEQGIEGWLWGDYTRATRIEAAYNNLFNRIVQEKHDGSHLTFPGLSRAVTAADGSTFTIDLKPHRVNAIWKVIKQGNTLFNHAVGSGKTWTSIMASMEMKRLGMIQRPMFVVPNHMLNQFSTEFYQAYPNAKLLIATKDQMSAKNRKRFAARIAADTWDGIIITHSSFGKMGLSKGAYQDYYKEQMEELELSMRQAQSEGNDSAVSDMMRKWDKFNTELGGDADAVPDGIDVKKKKKRAPTVKQKEAKKDRAKEKLKGLVDEESKDDGVTFEETGIDFLFVDEAHLFKSLPFSTMHTRIKGIGGGSFKRAVDLFLKMRHLEKSRPGRSAVFMTGTPVSNTMAELYTMQRYLQGPTLKKFGIDKFDAWAGTFGKIVTKSELASNSRDYKDTESFSEFVNMPELMTIAGSVMDTQTAEMLKLPRPELKGGKIDVVQAQLSPDEEGAINDLIAKMENREKDEPFLPLFTAGIQLATDMRLVDPSAPFNPNGKIAQAVNNIFKIWEEGNADPAAPNKGQLVFLDMGVPGSKGKAKAAIGASNETDAGPQDDAESAIDQIRKELAEEAGQVEEGEEVDVDEDQVEAEALLRGKFNLYQDIKDKLIAKGVPKEQIAFIHDAKNDDQKAKMFEKMRSGDIRVMIGSTGKMGVGTNVQKLLYAMHHLDAPWRPADLEQRDGRILRQGNKNKEVRIFRYITVKSFDAYRWQLLDRKSQFIGQLYAGAAGVRHMEDITPPLPEAAELKAAATGNPLIIERAELEREVKKLEVAERAHFGSQRSAAENVKKLAAKVESLKKFNEQYEQDAPRVEDLKGEAFKVKLDTTGKPTVVTDRKKAGEFIKTYLKGAGQQWYKTTVDLGEISSFAMRAEVKRGIGGVEVLPIIEGTATYQSNEPFLMGEDADPSQVVQRWVRLVTGVPAYTSGITAQIADAETTLPKMQEAATPKPFPQTDKLVDKRKRLETVVTELNRKPEADPSIAQGPPKDKPVTLVFAGSFNPIHVGHEIAIRNAAKFMEDKGYTVARTIIAPSPEKLLKDKLGERAYSLEDRAEMIRLQFGNDPAFPVSIEPALELQAMEGKAKRTHLANWAKSQYPDDTVAAVTGADAAPGKPPMFPSVYQGDPGTSHEGYYYVAMPRDEGDGMSSSTIRKALSEGKPVPEGMMTPEAEAYLRDMIARQPDLVAPAAPAPAPKELDPDAPNFSLPEPPRTLPNGHPLLLPHWGDEKTDPPEFFDRSPEREALRERLIEDRFAGKRPAMPGEQIAYVMGGGGASGKGTLLKRMKASGIVTDDFVELDPDSFKTGDPEKGWGGIPEYWQIDAEGDSRAAGVTHEESSMLNKRAMQRGLDSGYNLVLDQTLGDPAKGRKVLKMLKDAGYEVRLIGVTVAPETAVKRAVARAKGPERRYVPLDHLLKAHKGFSEGFESYAEMADYAALVDTDVSHGAGSLFVAEKKPGEALAILGEEAYIEFGRKADLNGQEDTLNDLRRTQGEVRTQRETRALAPAFDARELARRLGGAKGGRSATGPQDGSSVSRQGLTPPKDSDPVAWLRDIFMRYGVDPDAYGKGDANSLAKAVKEIQDGEINLIVRDGKLVRQGTVAAIEVVVDMPEGRMRLVEDRQEMADGRVRTRGLPQSLAEKMLPGEDPGGVIQRALSEELGIKSFKMLGSIKPETAAPFESPRYPGLMSEYTTNKATVALDPADFKPEYQEVQKDKTNYFVWKTVQADADVLPENVMASLAPNPVQGWFDFTDNLKAVSIPPRVILGEFRVETKPGRGTLTYTVHQGAPRIDEESGYDESQIGKFYLRTDATAEGFAVSVQNMVVDEDYRGRGIATTVFDMIERDIETTGVRFLPPPVETLSEDGKAFWNARDPEALANRERMERDVYFGDDVAARIGVNAPGVTTTPAFDAKRAEFEAELLRIAKRIKDKGVQVEVQNRIRIGKYELNGYYDSGRKLIKLALESGLDKALTTIRHEEIHALRDLGLLSDAEWKLLTEAANKARVRADIGQDKLTEYRQSYAAKVAKTMLARRGFVDLVQLPWADVEAKLADMFGFDPANRVESLKSLGLWDEAILQDLLDEEAVAVLVSERMGGQSYGTKVDAIVDRIAQFLERLTNALRGLGFQTVEDVFQAIDEGTIGKRDPALEGMGGTFVPKGLMFAIRAYHGAPRAFAPEPGFPAGRFRMDKMGSGEGAQIVARGLYFADEQQFAETYRDANGGHVVEVKWLGAEPPTPVQRRIKSSINASEGVERSLQDLRANAQRRLRYFEEGSGGFSANPAAASELREYLSEIDQIAPLLKAERTGRLYEVTLDVDQADLIDAGKPIAQHSAFVQSALEPLGVADAEGVVEFKGNEAALLGAGVKGVRYVDRMAERQGRTAYNYVIFDDSIIKITAVDGQPVEAEEKAEILSAAQEAEQQPGGMFDGVMASMASGDDPTSPLPQSYVDSLNRRIGELGRSPRPLDALGYYSGALEAAKSLPQNKGTPEQMLAMLKKEGAKEAELQSIGIQQFLKGKTSVTKDEIVQFVEGNRVGLREQVYGGRGYEVNFGDGNWHFIADLDEANRLVDDAGGGQVRRSAEPAIPPKWQSYSLDPSNPSRREVVIKLSQNDVNRSGYDFIDPHFPEHKGTVSNLMTSLVKHKGSVTFLIDQIQSTGGQKLRDGGVRDEAKIAELKAQKDSAYEALRAQQKIVDDFLKGNNVSSEFVAEKRDIPNARALISEKNRLSSEYARINAEYFTATASSPGNPLVNTTDQWTTTTLRRAIRQAAEADAEYIAIPHGDTVLSYNPGDTDGMRGFYGSRTMEGIVPKNLRKILQKLDKKSPAPIRVETLTTPSGERGYKPSDYNEFDPQETGFTLFRLTDAVKNAVLLEGQAMFSLAGGRDTDLLPNNVVDLASDDRFHSLFYGEPTPEAVREFGQWLKANPDQLIRLYHGSAAVNPIEQQGILKTTARRRNSLQSASGMVSLSVYPGHAEDFARFASANRGPDGMGRKTAVYAVDLRVAELLPDKDQLRNQRMFAERNVGSTLAESLVYGHGAWFKGDIPANRVVRYGPKSEAAPLPDNILASLAKWGNYQPLGIGTNPQYPNNETEAPEKGLSDVVADTVKALDLEGMARQGRLDPAMKRAARKMGGEMMGQTNRATGVVRLALKNDMATLAHEGGHALEIRASVRDDLSAIKTQFAEDLTVPPAANAPVPMFPQTGFSGIELDQDSIRLAIESVDAERQMRTLAAELAVLKSRPRSRQQEARFQQITPMYEQFQNVAGGNRETLVRRFGGDRADAVLTDLMPVDRATAPAYAATRFSKSGQPAPRVVIPPTDVELSEGFAEWFRIYLTNPKQAQALSRGFYDAFEDMLDAAEPEMLTRFQMVQEGVDALAKAAPVSAVRARVQSTVQPGLIESIRLGLSEAAEAGRIAAETARRTGDGNQVAAMISGFTSEIWRPMGDRLYGFYHAAFDARHPMKRAVQFLIDKAVENSGVKLGKGERAVVKALHDPYKLWRLAEHSKTHATAALQFGIVHKGQIDPSGPSYWDALTEAFGGSRRGQWNDDMAEMFGSYLIGRRMLAEFSRYDRGELENVPDTIISRDVWQKSTAQLEKEYPQFKRAAQTMYRFGQELLRYKFEAGFLTQEQFDEYRNRVDYTPLNRIMDAGTPSMLGGSSNANKRRLIYRFQGSTRDFINPLETIAQDMFATQQRVEMNRVIGAMDRMARAAGPGGGAIAERIPAKQMKATRIRVADVASLAKPLRGALARTGLDKADRDSLLSDAQDEMRDTMRLTAMQSGLSIDDQQMLLDTIDLLFDGEASKTIFQSTDISEAGEPIVYLWEGGQRIPIRMGDNEIAKDIFEGFQAFGSNDTNPLVDAAALGTQALRAGITKAPSYVLVNYLRDQLSTWVLSDNFVPFVTGARGLKSALTSDAVGKRYAAFAGLMGGVDANLIDQAANKHDVLTLRTKGFFAVPAKSGIGQVWQRSLKAMEITEAGTRFGHFEAAFNRAKADGMSEEEAAFEAAYAAHDVIDFSRRGSKTMEVSRIVAFLNAALQGLDSTRRAFTGERDAFTGYREMITPYIKAANGSPLSVAERKGLPIAARTFNKMAVLGMIGLALSLLYKDDEEYEEFNDYMRATHWFFKLGDTWVRFPKPFDLAIFSQIFEGAFDRVVKQDPRAGEKFLQSLKHTMVPPHEINVANLYYEMVTGIDTFRNREIVPMELSKLPPELQFGAYTSEMGRMIGSLTGMSPQKVDHLMGGLLGTIGRDIQTVSDAVLPAANQALGGAIPGVSDQPRAQKSFEDIAIVSRFTRRAGRGSLSSETFWKQMKMNGGEYVSAAEGYKALRNTGRGAEARDLLANVTDDQRAYAILETDFDEEKQDINPLNRAKQVMSAMSGIRKEMVMGRLYKGNLTAKEVQQKGDAAEEIILQPSKQKIVNEILEDLSMREARNALVAVGLPGWQQKEIMPTEGLMKELEAAAPEIAEELTLRLTKGRNKVYSFEGVREVWPEARDRLIAQDSEADLSDLVSDAKFYSPQATGGRMNLGGPVDPNPTMEVSDELAADLANPVAGQPYLPEPDEDIVGGWMDAVGQEREMIGGSYPSN